MWGMIATWRMALEGIEEGGRMLQQGGSAGDALAAGIPVVESNPLFKSVGYGGLPNSEGVVELDAGYMDGTTLGVGAVASVHDIASPFLVAKDLSRRGINSVLVSSGAEAYASAHGFERKNMLTERAEILYENRKKEQERKLHPYNGHDTVGMIALDLQGGLAAGTSTSGLFMKDPGRVGDSPMVGSGFYADSLYGAAVATGLGEDLMKGCISHEIVRRMKDGQGVQQACEEAVNELAERLRRADREVGDLSVVAMAKDGSWGCATNISNFSFAVYREGEAAQVYVASCQDGKTSWQPASQEWLDAYMEERRKPVTRI